MGALSLVYESLDETAWGWVVEHHAAVGIRAVALPPVPAGILDLVRSRNWDLGLGPWHRSPDMLPAPGGVLPDRWPVRDFSGGLASFQAGVEEVMARHGWMLCRFSGTPNRQEHRDLLQWLGDHHMRIWCAPVSNIRAFCEGKK